MSEFRVPGMSRVWPSNSPVVCLVAVRFVGLQLTRQLLAIRSPKDTPQVEKPINRRLNYHELCPFVEVNCWPEPHADGGGALALSKERILTKVA